MNKIRNQIRNQINEFTINNVKEILNFNIKKVNLNFY